MLQPPPVNADLRTLIRLAVREDLGSGDRTVALAIPARQRARARIVARREGVIAGTFLLRHILAEYPGSIRISIKLADGRRAARGAVVAQLDGPARTLLSAERVLLNFLGHLSGIATMTRRYVDAVRTAVPAPARGHVPALCDTRKTTPGFRLLDKYAVRCGGGANDRLGLYDGVMLKDNHLAALRQRLGTRLSLAELTVRARRQLPRRIPLWLEVDTPAQLKDALAAGPRGADIILLDNFTPAQMRHAVLLRKQNSALGTKDSALSTQHSALPLLEASGGITLDNIAAVAATGVDRISIGALTHSAPVLDLSMEFGP